MGHERFAVILSNVSIGNVARLASEVAGELPTEVVLHDDGAAGRLQNVHDGFPVQWHKPSDLKLVGRDASFVQHLYGFANDALGGAPTNQGDVRVLCTDKH